MHTSFPWSSHHNRTKLTMSDTKPTNASSPAPFRIAIIGGAIGGLSAALFLDHFIRTQAASQPVEIDVYEQASQYREIGAGIGLGVNAAKLLHAIPGVGAGMNRIQGRLDGSWFTFVRWDDGREITHVALPGKPTDEVRPVAMARSEFLEVLVEAIGETGAARLHTKKRFAEVKVSSFWGLVTCKCTHDGMGLDSVLRTSG